MYGGMCTGKYAEAMIRLAAECTKMGIQLATVFNLNSSLVPHARNTCANLFMRSKEMTHLLFIDADITFQAGDILAMFGLVGDGSKHPIMGAACALKTDTPTLNVFGLPNQTLIKSEAPVEVARIGTGLMMIHRSALERIAEAFPQHRYKDPETSNMAQMFFQSGIEGDRYVGEDFWFCRRARECGVSIWLAPWAMTEHAGARTYKGPTKLPYRIPADGERS